MCASPSITLYRLYGCPWCERVVAKLEAMALEYDSVFVPGEHSKRRVIKRVSGTRSAPVIVDSNTGVTMAESANILTYLDRTYGGGE
ncbi:MAG: glutathione S-transferase N-terminal domain-containing protein [Natronomonas sp.]|uniref:glutathione S-transferase N-terminal domain-containing protein n=1 Tax=Natronomonas sp. TaxID=2184060 RepID=UPI0028706539|nr:glutathione S-transferase N-terminal domain-containing protein [Natronomonas sp.]MDR9432176.1 glutathione S-transferase N-terminal domain-containing protein [Natronomonas sp.]